MSTIILALLFLAMTSSGAAAQSLAETFRARAAETPDLKFPEEAKKLGFFSPLGMAIYKPDGAGPFPAVVLVHSCGGVRQELHDWAKESLARGYVAFVLDSLGPRKVLSVCYPPTRVTFSRGVKDAYQALEHLKRFDFVDTDRVALMGFSWGAMVGLLANSREVAEAFTPSKRFAAVASFYPGCYLSTQRGALEFLRPDTDRPTLVLMGALDNETPPSECLPRLEALKSKDIPVAWHLYPNTTHCWDCASLNNHVKTDFQGNRVVYRYDSGVTKDSGKRAFDFFAEWMAPRK